MSNNRASLKIKNVQIKPINFIYNAYSVIQSVYQKGLPKLLSKTYQNYQYQKQFNKLNLK
jgi:hypothetical protein